jgi:hypothetical protein
MKKIFTVSIIAVIFLTIALIGAIVVLRMDEDTWICDGSQWVKHGDPKSPMPVNQCGKSSQIPPNMPAKDSTVNQNPQDQKVGGDRDEHGCIGSAGYTWCPEKNKCLRIWEEDCPSIPKPGSN